MLPTSAKYTFKYGAWKGKNEDIHSFGKSKKKLFSLRNKARFMSWSPLPGVLKLRKAMAE